MQYVPLATPSPDDMHHGHSHGHDHEAGPLMQGASEPELTIREQLTRDYSEETCNVDWALTTERDENGFVRLHYAALDNQVCISSESVVRHTDRLPRLRTSSAW